MNDVVVGIVAVVIGAVFCFRGWQLIRVILPIIGAFAGFVVGASIVASARNEELLGSVSAGWWRSPRPSCWVCWGTSSTLSRLSSGWLEWAFRLPTGR